MNLAKENIAFYLPSILKFIPVDDHDWYRIDELFSTKLQERFQNYMGKTIIIEASIFDIIIEVKKQNSQAIRLLDFFNNIILKLSSNLDESEIMLVAKNIKDILVTLDVRYLNYVGEIAILNNLIDTKEYKIEAVEAELSDSTKTIDFKLRKISDNSLYLVEVVNIHIDSDRIENDPEKIKKFLNHRLTQKIESKETKTNFYLIPVIWSGWHELKIYSEFFKNHKLENQNIIEPFSYITFIDPKNEHIFMHRFNRLSTLFI